jgi:uncharacterized protein YbjT (DUF2867 family)
MMASILVTGGTGNLGRHVVPLLRAQGHGIRVLSRAPHTADGIEYVVGDTVGGTGLDAAVTGVDTILHLAGSSKGDDVGTTHLVDAACARGVAHLVMISVIGADRMPIGYFRAKDRAEQALAASGVPYTVLRAAQFHDLVWAMFGGLVKSPVVPAPKAIRLEPVDVAAVAARLAELVDEPAAGRVTDLAGPEVLDAPALLRAIADARGAKRAFVPMGMPGAVGRAYRAGDNLAGPGVLRTGMTWAEYVRERVGVPASAGR